MAWFAVDSRWTRSVRWLYASRPARLGWYALAELANELRTSGVIPDAKDRDRAVADAARIRISELRACVRDGLAHYAEDGSLRLDGWLTAGEDRTPRAESTAPLPPRQGSPLTDAQRAQRRAAGLARASAAGRAGGAFVQTAQAVPIQEPAETTSATSGDDQRRPPAEPAGPLGTDQHLSTKIPDVKLKIEDELSLSSPSSPGNESPAATTTATDDLTSGEASGGTSGTSASSTSGAPAETPPAENEPTASPTTSQPHQTPVLPALRRVGIDADAVIRSVQRGDLANLLRAFGCQIVGHYEEWQREVDGLRLVMVAVILGWRRDNRDSIRLPSGFRAARLAWGRLTDDERRDISQQQVDRYHLPPLRPLPPPKTNGSG